MRRSWFAAFVLLLANWPVLAQQSLNDLSGPWQLFVDEWAIAEKSGLTRTYHAFQKHAGNPVLVGDQPWEYGDKQPGQGLVYLYGTALPDESGSGYRMWYTNLPYYTGGGYTGSHTLYATSTDGVNWTKPNLGIRSWNGSTDNNMIYDRAGGGGLTSVIQTPWDPDPSRRYRIMNRESDGYWAAYAPDGVHTVDAPGNPVFTGGSDVGQFMWDPFNQIYRGYVKNGWMDWNNLQRRVVALTQTTDIESWPVEQIILTPDAFDDRWSSNPTYRTHFYGLSAFAYESMYAGFLWIFRATDADGYYVGPVFTELVTSHDGVHWDREEGDRPPLLPLGPNGAWDDGQLYTATQPLVEGDTIRLYYGACDQQHGSSLKTTTCAIGLATLRKDGFASLDAGASVGTVTTKKLMNATGQLRVNCSAAAGWLRAEILDESENVLPGYSLADCAPIQADSVDQAVTWMSHLQLPPSPGSIRIRFVLQNASLYSFRTDSPVQIVPAPVITQHPQSRQVCVGTAVEFDVTATGQGTLSYRWRLNGADLVDNSRIAGASTPTLAIFPVCPWDAGQYQCVISDVGGPVTSNAATLSLTTAGFTDLGAVNVTGMAGDGSVICGDSAGHPVVWTSASGVVSLPLPASTTSATAAGVGIGPGGTVWLAVNSDAVTGRAKRWNGTIGGAGTYSDLPLLAGSLEWTARGLGASSSDVWICGSTLNGGDYGGRQAVVYRHSTGTLTAPSLPTNGHDHSDFHAVSDQGACGGQYQYGSSGAPTSGARNAMKYTGSGSCVAQNTLLGAPSTKYEAIAKAVSRTGSVLGGLSYYATTGSLMRPVLWTGPTTLTAIPFISGGDLDNDGQVLALDNDGALAGGFMWHNPGGSREAFLWDAAHGTRRLIDMLTNDYGFDMNSWALQEVRAISAGGHLIAGVGQHNGVPAGWVVSTETAPPPPTITQQPQVQKISPGGLAAFNVVAVGSGTLTYRWQKDGLDLAEGGHCSGTTTSTLSVSGIDADDAGSYRCLVSIPCAITVSGAASLIPIVRPDLDEDGDVDIDDFTAFSPCVAGPEVPVPEPCGTSDFDTDGDLDQDDFAVVQRCFSGPGRLPDLQCADP